MSIHPVLCGPLLDALVDPLDFVAWRAGRSSNDPPVAVAVNLGLLDDGTATLITPAMLLAGAADPDGDALTVTGLAVTSVLGGDGSALDPSRATVDDNADGTWTLTLADNWRGTIALSFTVGDGMLEVAGTATAAVEHVVYANDGTDAEGFINVLGGTLSSVDGRLAFDLTISGGYVQKRLSVDPGGTYRFSARYDAGTLTAPQRLVLGVYNETHGNWAVLPSEKKFGVNIIDFTVLSRVSIISIKNAFYSAPGLVYIDDMLLIRLNAAPVVSGKLALGQVAEGSSITWTAEELLATSTDPDGDTLSVVSVAAASGAVQGNGNGTWTFTPPVGFYGDVTITVGVTDGTATVSASGAVHVVAAVTPTGDAGAQ